MKTTFTTLPTNSNFKSIELTQADWKEMREANNNFWMLERKQGEVYTYIVTLKQYNEYMEIAK